MSVSVQVIDCPGYIVVTGAPGRNGAGDVQLPAGIVPSWSSVTRTLASGTLVLFVTT